MKISIRKIVLTAMFIAIGYFLPFLTAQVRDIGNMLCPMHLPIMICGFVCGAPYAAVAGIVTPLLRSLTVSMPALYPNAVGMAIELASYGVFTALIYKRTKKNVAGIYISLITAMLAGRIIWGIASYFLYMSMGNTFTMALFLSRAFLEAIPGILIQLILVPAIVTILKKNKYI